VAVAIGILCGALNGFLIAKVGIYPILVTLGTQNAFMGVGMILTRGRAEGNFPQALLDFGNAHVFGVPLLTVLFLALFAVMCVAVHKTPYGRKLQLLGSNSKASWYSGIDNVKVTFTTYMMSGAIAGLCGMVIMARSNSAKADYGTSYVFQALLTCVLGGISPLGGRGKVYNVLLSLVALQILGTGFNMLRVSPLIRDSIFGFLLVFSILLDYISEKRRTDRLNRKAMERGPGAA
jgi:simple sugar transport system permease protein